MITQYLTDLAHALEDKGYQGLTLHHPDGDLALDSENAHSLALFAEVTESRMLNGGARWHGYRLFPGAQQVALTLTANDRLPVEVQLAVGAEADAQVLGEILGALGERYPT